MARPTGTYPAPSSTRRSSGRRGGQTLQMVPVPSSGRHAPRSRRSGRTMPMEMVVPPAVRRTQSPIRIFFTGVFVACAVVAIVLFVLGSLIERQAARDEAAPADAIVVLGAAQWNGRPSPVLQARLDHAYDLWKAKYAPAIIVTGGTGEGDTFSESEVARQYLVQRGVPTNALLMERQGRTSYESMVGASTLMQQRGWQRALLVSDPFHMLRLKRMADDLGLTGLTSPTRTSPIVSGSETEWYYKAREVVTLVGYLITHQ